MAILFSGGLDCTVLARLCHDILPAATAIDLLNVAFENPRIVAQLQKQQIETDVYEACPDRMTGRKAFAELCELCPERIFRFIAVSPLTKLMRDGMAKLKASHSVLT
jgi:asparagine synthetase B (glutamine-hydrolysing)